MNEQETRYCPLACTPSQHRHGGSEENMLRSRSPGEEIVLLNIIFKCFDSIIFVCKLL